MAYIDVVSVKFLSHDFGFAIVKQGEPVTKLLFRASHDAFCYALGWASSHAEGLAYALELVKTERDELQETLDEIRENALERKFD